MPSLHFKKFNEQLRVSKYLLICQCKGIILPILNYYIDILTLSQNTTNLQQTTLNLFCQKKENLYNLLDNLWLKVENIVSKGEIAHFEQFLLLSPCFQKAVCCRGVRNRLYEGKGLTFYKNTTNLQQISLKI